jgi:hypothetical protein
VGEGKGGALDRRVRKRRGVGWVGSGIAADERGWFLAASGSVRVLVARTRVVLGGAWCGSTWL